MNKKIQEKALRDYQQKGDEVIRKMYAVLTRAQRKVDDQEYRKTLEKLENYE